MSKIILRLRFEIKKSIETPNNQTKTYTRETKIKKSVAIENGKRNRRETITFDSRRPEKKTL